MNALIVEDEPQAVSALKYELKMNCSDINIIGVAANIKEGVSKIKSLNPELVFMDIQLSDGNSFEILEQINHINFKIIFTTAYSQYALKAIKASALDYLLKPINSKELKSAILKAKKYNETFFLEKIKLFVENNKINQLRKIALHTSEGVNIYEVDNIIKCISEGNYTNIHLKNGSKILVTKTLKDLELILNNQGFERIHHSYLININHLIKYINKDGGYVVMSDKSTLTISQRKKSSFLKKLEYFKF